MNDEACTWMNYQIPLGVWDFPYNLVFSTFSLSASLIYEIPSAHGPSQCSLPVLLPLIPSWDAHDRLWQEHNEAIQKTGFSYMHAHVIMCGDPTYIMRPIRIRIPSNLTWTLDKLLLGRLYVEAPNVWTPFTIILRNSSSLNIIYQIYYKGPPNSLRLSIIIYEQELTTDILSVNVASRILHIFDWHIYVWENSSAFSLLTLYKT